eukprot:6224257-Alexandrium_andersonii.AAC.1
MACDIVAPAHHDATCVQAGSASVIDFALVSAGLPKGIASQAVARDFPHGPRRPFTISFY